MAWLWVGAPAVHFGGAEGAAVRAPPGGAPAESRERFLTVDGEAVGFEVTRFGRAGWVIRSRGLACWYIGIF